MPTIFYHQHIPFGFAITGSGATTIVLLHGFGEYSWVFDEQVKLLQQQFTVVTIDLPGCGTAFLQDDSNAAAFLPLKNLQFLAEGIAALLNHIEVKNILLLGHSMGGYIALEIEKKYPLLTTAFGLIHSTAYADTDEKKLSRKKGIELMEQYGGEAFLKNTIPNLFSTYTKKIHSYSIDKAIEKSKYLQTLALQAYYTAIMNRENSNNLLATTLKPILFIAGTEDIAVPLTDMVKQASQPTISYIHVLQQVGHMGMLENSEAVTNYITNFANSI